MIIPVYPVSSLGSARLTPSRRTSQAGLGRWTPASRHTRITRNPLTDATRLTWNATPSADPDNQVCRESDPRWRCTTRCACAPGRSRGKYVSNSSCRAALPIRIGGFDQMAANPRSTGSSSRTRGRAVRRPQVGQGRLAARRRCRGPIGHWRTPRRQWSPGSALRRGSPTTRAGVLDRLGVPKSSVRRVCSGVVRKLPCLAHASPSAIPAPDRCDRARRGVFSSDARDSRPWDGCPEFSKSGPSPAANGRRNRLALQAATLLLPPVGDANAA